MNQVLSGKALSQKDERVLGDLRNWQRRMERGYTNRAAEREANALARRRAKAIGRMGVELDLAKASYLAETVKATTEKARGILLTAAYRAYKKGIISASTARLFGARIGGK